MTEPPSQCAYRKNEPEIEAAEIFARPPMSRLRVLSLLLVVSLAMLGGCATRPINPPIEQVDLNKGYRYETRWEHRSVYDNENIVILAFSGGGTRAAAFAYGASKPCGEWSSSCLRAERSACSTK
jgi:hypothetical protein